MQNFMNNYQWTLFQVCDYSKLIVYTLLGNCTGNIVELIEKCNVVQ